jgi:murein DD-endopeptidase MepM/ murein hydrolase activator NlpD
VAVGLKVGLARARVIVGCVAVALCVLTFAAPAAADDGPTAPAPRAAPVPRSYPRGFGSYDDLIGYATDVARTQSVLSERLAAVRVRDDAASGALAAAVDPRERGGLLRSRADVMIDGLDAVALRAQLSADSATAKQLLGDGALATSDAWRMPLDGELTQAFGDTDVWVEPSRTYGGVFYPHFHEGVDLAAAYGSDIVAPAAGRVIFAGMMSDGAEVVVIAHDGGLVSLFAHLGIGPIAPPVGAGDVVHAGDRIGSVGMTGMTTGPHLHWAVWRGGDLIDPLGVVGG